MEGVNKGIIIDNDSILYEDEDYAHRLALIFKGEYTRFENPDDNALRALPILGGEIRGSKMNGENYQTVGGEAFGDLPVELPPTINDPAPY